MRKTYSYQEKNEDPDEFSRGESSTGNKLAYLLVGGGIGALMALLFAPKAGRELRGDLIDVTRKGYDKTLETAQQVRDHSGEYYQQLRQNVNTAYQRATSSNEISAADKLSSKVVKARETLHQLTDEARESAKLTKNS